tara:strand:+ start:318 stop:554 length:237 start_codon:yes stop_codon:yes gene_type:complete
LEKVDQLVILDILQVVEVVLFMEIQDLEHQDPEELVVVEMVLIVFLVMENPELQTLVAVVEVVFKDQDLEQVALEVLV